MPNKNINRQSYQPRYLYLKNGAAYPWQLVVTADEVHNLTKAITYGNVTPNFGKKKRLGQYISPLAYQYDYESRRIFPGSFRRPDIYDQGNWSVGNCLAVLSGSLGINTNPDYKWASNLERVGLISQARLKAYNKMKESSLNLGQALAESRETVGTILGVAKRIGKFGYLLKKGKFGSALKSLGLNSPRRAMKNAQDCWLEARYGVRPLLSDAYNAAEALTLLSDDSQEWILRAGARSDIVQFNDVQRVFLDNNRVLCSTYTERMSVAKIVVHALLTDHRRHNQTLLGLTNPLSLAWELLPLSFVADWFVPIGKWAGSLDAFSGLTFLRESQSFHQTSVVNRDVVLLKKWTKASPDSSGFDIASHKDSASGIRGDRQSLGTPTYANMYFRPHIPNAKQLVDAVALIGQLFK